MPCMWPKKMMTQIHLFFTSPPPCLLRISGRDLPGSERTRIRCPSRAECSCFITPSQAQFCIYPATSQSRAVSPTLLWLSEGSKYIFSIFPLPSPSPTPLPVRTPDAALSALQIRNPSHQSQTRVSKGSRPVPTLQITPNVHSEKCVPEPRPPNTP